MSYVNTAVGQTELEHQACVAAVADHTAWVGEQRGYDQAQTRRAECLLGWSDYDKAITARNLTYDAAVKVYVSEKAKWDVLNTRRQAYEVALALQTKNFTATKSALEAKYGVKLPTGVVCVSQAKHDQYYGKCHVLKGLGRYRGMGLTAAEAQAMAAQAAQATWMDMVPPCLVAEMPICKALTAAPKPGPKPTAPTLKTVPKPQSGCGTAPALRVEPASPSSCPLPPSGGGPAPAPTPTPYTAPSTPIWIDDSGLPVVAPAPIEEPRTQQAAFFGGGGGTAGLLAILVVGGLGYYAWTKRKKKAA